jgi:pimeloyl-ACP methyl ester carboxylesterase
VTIDPSTSTFLAADGVRLTFDTWQAVDPKGVPVVLHHGFAADTKSNWVLPQIVAFLVADQRTVISIDARGHGRSEKPHEPSAYGHNVMSNDLSTLFDHLGFEAVDLVGYSMGGFVAGITASRNEPRLRSVVLGGIGARALSDKALDRDHIADGLVAEDPKSIADRTARQFRRFADSTGADRLALAAIMRSPWHPITNPGTIGVPCLVQVGRNDDLAVDAQVLTGAIPGCRLVVTDGDHLGAIAVPEYAAGIVGFLNEVDSKTK